MKTDKVCDAVMKYDAVNNKWDHVTTMPEPRHHHAGMTLHLCTLTLVMLLYYVLYPQVCSVIKPRREKPVFGVSDKARFKPVSSATETSSNIVMSLVASLDIIISKSE